MSRRFWRLLALPALLLLASPLAADDGASFSAAQKAAIETMIRQFLLAHPEILIEMSDELENRQKAQAEAAATAGILEHREAVLSSPYDFVLNPEGKVPVVEFFDYNCGYCKRMLPAMQQLQAAGKDVRIIFKELPILSDESIEAARVAIAARAQGKYLELHNALMQQRGRVDGTVAMRTAEGLGLDMAKLQQDLHSPDVGAEIDANRALAEALGIRGTPTLLIGETLVPGAVPYERLSAIIEERLQSCQVC